MIAFVRQTFPSLVVGATLGAGMLLGVLALDGRGGKKGRPQAQARPSVMDVLPEPSFASLLPSKAVSRTDSALVEHKSHTQLTSKQIARAVSSTWPGDEEAAVSVLYCESSGATHPDTWDLSKPDGGPLQINKQTWAAYFEAKYGWTWSQIVRDLAIHLAATREIYEKTGDWSLWACAPLNEGFE